MSLPEKRVCRRRGSWRRLRCGDLGKDGEEERFFFNVEGRKYWLEAVRHKLTDKTKRWA
jgi:hypothetical protein